MRDSGEALSRATAETSYWDTTLSTSKHRQPLWRTHSDAVNLQWLMQWLPPTAGIALKTDLFDEALADGLCPRLATRCRRVIGIDLAATTARAALQRDSTLPGTAADVRRLPFTADSFDVVISTSTLDHFASLEDIGTSLAELHRVLRPGGQLLLTLDNLANPLVALRNALPFRFLNVLGIVPFRVGVTCTPPTLLQLLRQAAFAVDDVGAILHCPRVFAVAGAALLHRIASDAAQRRYLHGLMAFERLATWPTRFRSGYFIAVVATKRS